MADTRQTRFTDSMLLYPNERWYKLLAALALQVGVVDPRMVLGTVRPSASCADL